VVSATQISGGEADNVIAQTATLRGTVRTLGEDLRIYAEQRIAEIAQGIATAHRAKAKLTYERICSPTINHPDNAGYAAQVAGQLVGEANVDMDFPINMGGEDFSFMLQALPGAHMFIGHGDSAGLHHHEYNFDDDIIPLGCEYWVGLAQARGAVLTGNSP
tara:strand:- start:152 stop:634 length:483 start_codon:yes stop_codon:yes gene_type:complete